ncbi:DUF2946 family protein [Chitinimonas lacunae]|uniref:DUF2946 family protein n=1 Tax=Chitinimonas lacunae TaxID=1963018 RepID=A0ABV8MNB0_9NEIS
MDDIVRAAMAKWPTVPAVYGWLSLDARGDWHLQGQRLSHPGLLDFIGRNYQADADGAWHFQNGPQRVYVECERAPLVARLGADGLCDQFGRPLGPLEAVYVDQTGDVWFASAAGPASLDDRELAAWIEQLEGPALDEWLDQSEAAPRFCGLALQAAQVGEMPTVLGFIAVPCTSIHKK